MNRRRLSLVGGVAVLVVLVALALAARADGLGSLWDQHGSSTRVTRDQAIRQAEAEAKSNEPGRSILEARVDEVTAELISGSDAYSRLGRSRPPPVVGPLHLPDPVWWVTVRGYFRYSSGPPYGNGAAYEASEQTFAYDAISGEPLGGTMR